MDVRNRVRKFVGRLGEKYEKRTILISAQICQTHSIRIGTPAAAPSKIPKHGPLRLSDSGLKIRDETSRAYEGALPIHF